MVKNIHGENNEGGQCPPSCFNPDFAIEKAFIDRTEGLIAGADEAGRGSLAGPLAVGLVIYPRSVIMEPAAELLDHIRDSKQLTPQKRLRARDIIRKWAIYSDVVMVSHRTIDAININRATEFALNRIIEGITDKLGVVLIDGNYSFDMPVTAVSVIKGDMKSVSIASASIMAKVRRDEVMERMDGVYPGYGFSRHKGYGTASHRQAIMDLGYSAVHRRSYEPVKSMAARREEGPDED